jgi:chromosome segregation ATPase
VLNIGLIADRIDAQFDRICKQQEAVLQSIIDEVIEERKSDRLRIEKLERQRDEARAERDELRHKVDELESFDPETSIAAFGDDNGKLRRMLSRAAALLANAEQDRDANYAYWMDCKEKVVHANATIEELQAKLDAITAALNG